MKNTFAFLFAALAPLTLLAEPTLLSVSAAAKNRAAKSVQSDRARLQILHMGGKVVVRPSPDGRFHIAVSDAENLGKKSGFLSSSPKVEAILEEVGQKNLRLRVAAVGSLTPTLRAPEESLLNAEEGVFSLDGSISIGGGPEIGDSYQSNSKRPLCTLTVLVPVAHMEHLSVVNAHGNIEIQNVVFEGAQKDHIVHTQTENGKVSLDRVSNGAYWGPSRGMSAINGCALSLVTKGYEERVAQLFAE